MCYLIKSLFFASLFFYSTQLVQFIFLPFISQLLNINISFLLITTHVLSYLKYSAFPCSLFHIYLFLSFSIIIIIIIIA